MFLYIIHTPLLELKLVGKKSGLYTGKDGTLMKEGQIPQNVGFVQFF